MLVSTIVLIIVRLFVIQWTLQGLTSLALIQVDASTNGGFGYHPSARIIPALILFGAAVFGWLVAPSFSRWAAGRQETTVAINGLTREDLYAFGFTFLGLYFMLQSLGNLVSWFHYALSVAATRGDWDPERKQSLYGFAKVLITMLAGFVCFISGHKWARKMCQQDGV